MKNKAFWILSCILIVALVFVNYVQNNLGNIYAMRGDYYFRKNNIQSAQENYEKAFDLGFEDSTKREMYINSLINSPLTIDSQKKLINFLEKNIEDTAYLKAKFFVNDLRREIHKKYPENFITNAVYNQKIVHWGKLPITYSIESIDKMPNYYIDEIKKALVMWEIVTDRQILFEENSVNPNIVIKFDTENPATAEDKKFVVAYTTPYVTLDYLKNMEIIFYLNNPEGEFLSKNQIYNTALHEIAHALGFMGHSNNRNNVMYLTKDSITALKDERESLSEGDINTIKLLYKLNPDITNAENIEAEYIPDLVLGSDSDVNDEKIKEAEIYIKKAPDLPAGYIDLAEAFVIKKDYEKAIKSLEKALRLADTEDIIGMIYFNLAVTNFYMDNFEKSKGYLVRSIEIEKTEEKYHLLGEIYLREGKIQEAIKVYKSLLSKNPNNIDYVIALANIYVLNRDYINARRILARYLKSNPNEKTNSRLKPYGILRMGL